MDRRASEHSEKTCKEPVSGAVVSEIFGLVGLVGLIVMRGHAELMALLLLCLPGPWFWCDAER